MSKRNLHFLFGLTLAFLSISTFIIFSFKELPKSLDGSSPADFPNYYFAGKRLFSAEPIYSDLQEDVLKALGWQYTVYPADPPSTVLFLSGLSFFDYNLAWLIFAAFSVVIALGTSYFVSLKVGYSRPLSLLFSTLTLGSAPFLFLLKRNHMEMWLVLFAVLGWSLLKHHKPLAGKLMWGIAAALKLFPLLWLFVTVHRNPGSFFKAVAFTALLILLSCLAIGLENSLYFVTDVLPRSKQWYGVIGNYSLISVAHALEFALVGWIVAILLGLSVFYAPLWEGPIDDLFVKAISLSLILSPLSWINYQVLLLPCLIIVSRYIPFHQTAPRWLFFIIALVIWGWPGEIPLNSITLTILFSSMPLVATCGLFYLSHRYINHASR